MTRGLENVLESSTCSWYVAAAVTSLQSSVTGSVTPAPLAGLRSVGAAGVGGGGALTVSTALRVTPRVPLMVADLDCATVCVETVNVRLVVPAATVTLAGTVAAAVLLLASATTLPPAGAVDDSVTVPVDDAPPVRLEGLSETAAIVGPLVVPGTTVSPAVCPIPVLSAKPWMTTSEGADTDLVVIVKFALVAPPGTVMLDGTSATEKLLVPSVTVTPPARAALVSVAVPTAGVPAVAVRRSTLNDASGIFETDTEGLTVSVPVAEEAPNAAVTPTVALVDRLGVVNANIALVSPANRVTPAGTDTMPVLLTVSGTKTDAVVALERLTRPIPPSPALTVDGWNVTDDSAIGGAAWTVSGALTTVSPRAANNVTVRVSGRPRVNAENVPDEAPALMAAKPDPTSATDGSLLQILTNSCGPAGQGDAGIGAATVTVPVTPWPPLIVDCEKLSVTSRGSAGRT
jgi:hypothetical protein